MAKKADAPEKSGARDPGEGLPPGAERQELETDDEAAPSLPRKKGRVMISEVRSVDLDTEEEVLGDCTYEGQAIDVLEAVKENLEQHGDEKVSVTITIKH